MRDVSVEDHLEPREAVVAEAAVAENSVALPQRVDYHVIVEHN